MATKPFKSTSDQGNDPFLKDALFRNKLKAHLWEHGYLPEAWVFPPIFELKKTSGPTAGDDKSRPGVILHAPKQRYGWRDFTLIHPQNFLRMVNLVSTPGFEKCFREVANESDVVSYSIPTQFETTPNRPAADISRFVELRHEILRHAGDFPVVGVADIASCYHSMYSHSLSWACTRPKSLQGDASATNCGQSLDKSMRRAQLSRSNGFPVGPRLSDYLAELVLLFGDTHLEIDGESVKILRYRDDYYVLAKDELTCSRTIREIGESLRHVGLRLNSQKTHIQGTADLTLNRWQDDYDALKRRFGVEPEVDDLLPGNAVSKKSIAGFLRGVLALLGAWRNERAIAERALEDLSAIEVDDFGDEGVYLLMLIADSRSPALPRALNLITRYALGTPAAKKFVTQTFAERSKRARDDADIFAFSWYAYNHFRLTGKICGALSAKHPDPLVQCLAEYVKAISKGKNVGGVANPLWSKVPIETVPAGAKQYDDGVRASTGFELRYRAPLQQASLDDELAVDFDYLG